MISPDFQSAPLKSFNMETAVKPTSKWCFTGSLFLPADKWRSKESQCSTSGTDHSSHDDFPSHVLSCMSPSPEQANTVKLHVKTPVAL